jgi:hypothetical protein
MTNVLELQKLSSDTRMTEATNLFASAISTICPLNPETGDGSFQLE